MIRRMTTRLILAVAVLLMTACSGEEAQAQTSSSDMTIHITIDGKTLPVNLVDNEATRTLVAALQETPITYEADGTALQREPGKGFYIKNGKKYIK